MDIDKGNRNYYSCRGFGYLAKNCRNRGTRGKIGEDRRLKYNKNQGQSNLNREGDLIILD